MAGQAEASIPAARVRVQTMWTCGYGGTQERAESTGTLDRLPTSPGRRPWAEGQMLFVLCPDAKELSTQQNPRLTGFGQRASEEGGPKGGARRDCPATSRLPSVPGDPIH